MRRKMTTTAADNSNNITSIFHTNSSIHNNDGSSYSSPYLCNFCDVPLIKKMDDPGESKRYICPRCAKIQDPLKVDEFNKVKHAERGQTIRSSNSVGNEGTPFAEMFNSNNTSTTNDNEGSLKGTQLSRALQKTDTINYNDLVEWT